MIILCLSERDLPSMRAAILSAPEKADALEVRLDALAGLDPADLPALFEGSARPLIACCRRRRDGGQFTGSEARRREILWGAVEAGASYVDLEWGPEGRELAAQAAGVSGLGVILSHHDWKGMPRDLAALYRRMARLGGLKAIKIVGTARHPVHALPMRDLLGGAKGAGPPIVGFCMGIAGAVSRILAQEWGSWATYASPGAGRESAPGQISLPDLLGVYRVEEIDEETRLTGIIGSPLSHTLSPVMHNAAYHADGLNFRYVPLEIPTKAGLRHLRRLIRELKIRGLSVTAPHKIAVVRWLDRMEPLARRIGAANTIIWDGRRLTGFNTDASGGLAALKEALGGLGISLPGLTVAVVGSGGAARALAHASAAAGARVVVASRSLRPGRSLARAVGGRHIAPGRLARESYDVLINCTPVGMNAPGGRRRPALPVPERAIRGKLVYDVIYSPVETPLLARAKARGIPTLGGFEMLVRQAAEQYELFTGRGAPIEVMREAGRVALGYTAGSS